MRACDGCERRVYHYESVGEAETRARDGYCVAVPGALVARVGEEVSRAVVGRPDPIARWAERIFAEE